MSFLKDIIRKIKLSQKIKSEEITSSEFWKMFSEYERNIKFMIPLKDYIVWKNTWIDYYIETGNIGPNEFDYLRNSNI